MWWAASPSPRSRKSSRPGAARRAARGSRRRPRVEGRRRRRRARAGRASARAPAPRPGSGHRKGSGGRTGIGILRATAFLQRQTSLGRGGKGESVSGPQGRGAAAGWGLRRGADEDEGGSTHSELGGAEGSGASAGAAARPQRRCTILSEEAAGGQRGGAYRVCAVHTGRGDGRDGDEGTLGLLLPSIHAAATASLPCSFFRAAFTGGGATRP
jgi:hypothetical protein